MDVLNKYLATVPFELHELVRAVDTLVRNAAPALSPSLKWGNLTYHHTANVCALVAHKQYVNLQVWGGVTIADPYGFLKGTGKQMRHLKLVAGNPLNRRAIAAIVHAAAEASLA